METFCFFWFMIWLLPVGKRLQHLAQVLVNGPEEPFRVRLVDFRQGGHGCQVAGHHAALDGGDGGGLQLVGEVHQSLVASNWPRLRRAPLQAKMVATELVEVVSPFKYL